MPGYLSPAYQTIFNEKTFRFTDRRRPDGAPLLEGETASLLELRATHGPFTARLPSKAVDLAIYRACLEDKRGVRVTYSDEMRHSPPEFVKTYFDWLREARGLTMEDPIQIGMFAHAANGGVFDRPRYLYRCTRPVCGRRGHRGHARGRPHWRPFNGQRPGVRW